MKKMLFIFLAVNLLVVCTADARTWTSVSGQTLEADFVKIEGDIVHLKKADGKIIGISPLKLSAKDRAYVSSLSAGPAKSAAPVKSGDLAAEFVNPPDAARPHTLWHWMNGNLTKEGITGDLEAMKKAGVGGTVVFQISAGIPKGPVDFMGPQWQEIVRHAAEESARLGIELNFFNCPGWSASGGPWIKPEESMQKVVWTETLVSGPGKISQSLPQPQSIKGHYRDIAVIAFKKRAGYKGKLPKDQDPGHNYFPENLKVVDESGVVNPSLVIPATEIVDISDKMDASGKLSWDAPEGEWVVVRLGHTSNGKTNSVAPDGGGGLECDKLNRAAVAKNFEGMMGEIIKVAGPLTGKAPTAAHLDSYEGHYMGWTPGFREEFIKSRGYDPIKFFPVITGRVVGSPEISERFLWDLRYVIGRLMVENYMGTMAEMCHKHNMKFTAENYGWPSMQTPFDHLAACKHVDVPMGEFWQGRALAGDRRDGRVLNAISGAHIHGKKVISAEAFTTRGDGRWQNYPYKLKGKGDYMYVLGINHFSFHRFAHQPWPGVKPGMTMGPFGFHFDRTTTWWEPGAAWLKYLARCQHLLQQGLCVVDICYYWGNKMPNPAPLRQPLREQFDPHVPDGYRWDMCSRNSIFERMTIKNGKIVLPDGMTYSVFVMPENRKISLDVLKKIKEMVEQGLTVVGPSPVASPSLKDYPKCDEEIKQIVSEMWGNCDGTRVTVNSCGKGKVFWSDDLKKVLLETGVAPDFDYDKGHPNLRFNHRKTDNMDMYFVANGSTGRIDAECSFRVAGKQPELWHPETGEMRDLTDWEIKDGRTYIPLRFEDSESYFVVFRQPCSAKATQGKQGNFPEYKEVQTIAGAWEVAFPEGWGAPASIKLDKLISWTEHPDKGVKYFSGTATYRKIFEYRTSNIEHRTSKTQETLTTNNERLTTVCLALGEVKVIAEVVVNGRNCGVAWTAPYRVDITDAVKAGENLLEVKVTNLWPNRLIGDEIEFPADTDWSKKGTWPQWLKDGKTKDPSGRYTFSAWPHYKADSPLFESGLLGPVRILREE